VITPAEGARTPTDLTNRAFLPTLTDFAYKRRVFEVLHDVLVIVLAYHAAFLMRFDGELVEPFYTRMLESLPVVVVVQVSAFLALGLYRGLWRYTSMSDLVILIRAVGGAWLATVVALYFVFRLDGFSRGVLVMDGVLLCLAITGSRVGFRLLRLYLGRLHGASAGKKVLIYGAGDGGELLVRELQNNFQLGLTPVGFLDDDPQKHGRVIHGLRVLGSVDRLGDLASRVTIDEILISTAKIDTGRLSLLTEPQGIRTRRMRIALD
jgi:UDP-GlcNAc:undecaprenyl-phosphate GlcNAc-1-phosphate transferase